MDLTFVDVYALIMTAVAIGLGVALVRAYGGNVERLREGFELGKQLFTHEQFIEQINALDKRWQADDRAWNDGLADVLRNGGKLVYGELDEALATSGSTPANIPPTGTDV